MRRRDFMKRLSAAAAAPALLSAVEKTVRSQGSAAERLSANEAVDIISTPVKDENLVVIFSDTHVNPGVYQEEQFAKRLASLMSMNPLPAHLLFYGDFAYLEGKPAEYANLRRMMEPVEAAGITWDLAFGNHDRRENFFNAFPERVQETPNVPGKYVSIVQTPKADFILLDSLLVGKVEGAIDDEQRAWLEKTLSEYKKPVFVGAHHSLDETKVDDLLRGCPAVAGYINGHHHYWNHTVADGLPALTLPSTGHWGDIGYVVLNLSDNEALFRLKLEDCYKFNTNKRDEKAEENLRKKRYDVFAVPLPKLG